MKALLILFFVTPFWSFSQVDSSQLKGEWCAYSMNFDGLPSDTLFFRPSSNGDCINRKVGEMSILYNELRIEFNLSDSTFSIGQVTGSMMNPDYKLETSIITIEEKVDSVNVGTDSLIVIKTIDQIEVPVRINVLGPASCYYYSSYRIDHGEIYLSLPATYGFDFIPFKVIKLTEDSLVVVKI